MRKIYYILILYIIATLTGILTLSNANAQDKGTNAKINSTEATNTQKETLTNAAKILAADPIFSQAAVGICIRHSDGTQIAALNPEKMLMPASNMKLITTGAALAHFGADHRFKTEIAYDGTISEGCLKGNIHIIGKGDPTLGSKDSIASPLKEIFRQWYKLITDAGIKRIEGHVIGDGRWFEGPMEEQSWLWEDIGTYYGSGTCGLMFYENMLSFSVSPGMEVGASVNIKPHYPHTPWMKLKYSCSTGKKGTGDELYMFTSDLSPVAEIRGTFGIDRGHKRVDCSNKYPEYTCAAYFTEYLEQKGIHCTEGPADFKLKSDKSEKYINKQLTILGESASSELARIAFETNHISNNVFAETLLRQLGKDIYGCAEYPQSIEALKDVLKKELGIDISKGIFIKDGSGLSRGNLVSPDFLCRFLEAMMKTDVFNDFIGGLPRPGGHGSLYFNMSKYADSLKSRIRLKSGSMSGVRCYSGYIIPTSGRIEDSVVISVMVNNCTGPNWKVLKLLDEFIAKVAASLM